MTNVKRLDLHQAVHYSVHLLLRVRNWMIITLVQSKRVLAYMTELNEELGGYYSKAA